QRLTIRRPQYEVQMIAGDGGFGDGMRIRTIRTDDPQLVLRLAIRGDERQTVTARRHGRVTCLIARRHRARQLHELGAVDERQTVDVVLAWRVGADEPQHRRADGLCDASAATAGLAWDDDFRRAAFCGAASANGTLSGLTALRERWRASRAR